MKNAHVLLAAAAFAFLASGCGRDPGGPSPAEPPCQRVSDTRLELPPPPALLGARRALLARLVGDGIVLFGAGEPSTDPQNSGYRGDSNFFYFTGFDVPGSRLVMHVRNGQVDSTLVYVPDAQTTNRSSDVLLSAVTGATAVRCGSTYAEQLRARLPAGQSAVLRLYPGNSATDTVVYGISAQGGITLASSPTAVNSLRLVKDSAEIARMRRAAEITASSIRAALDMVRVGRSESDVANRLLSEYHTQGAAYASFPSIVASDTNALTLHYQANQRTFTGGELVLMDVGAEYARYAGDVTRTVPVSGRFSARQRALYELVLGAQQAAIDAVRPGSTLAALESIARDYLRTHSGTLCGTKSCDQYFVHSLSHSLGLNVHDAGLGNSTLLYPGMVITIEPGIYLRSDGIGIRIEDDVLVTESGHEVLSSGMPKTVSEIEALFSGR